MSSTRANRKWRPNLVVQTIENALRSTGVTGKIISIGAAAREYDLLNVAYLRESPDKFDLLGLNIDTTQLGKFGNFEVIEANAHAMPLDDASVDGVICNAMLEHDPHFWLTLVEIRRVLKPGGLAVIGVPGYTAEPLSPLNRFLPGRGAEKKDLKEATMTYIVHNAPGDFYRFSEESMRDVLLEGFEQTQSEVVMKPPRIIGWGRRAATA